jgi:hypothetical protein
MDGDNTDIPLVCHHGTGYPWSSESRPLILHDDLRTYGGAEAMKVDLVADPEQSGWTKDCPKIWRTADGRYWLQGTRPPADLLATLPISDGDFLVEFDPRLMGWTPSEEA